MGLLVSSCVKVSEFDESIFFDMENHHMGKDVEYIFKPFEKLSEEKCKGKFFLVELAVRYSDICDLQSLPLDIEYASLAHDSIKNLRILMPLFNEADEMQGKGNFGVFQSGQILLKKQPYEEGFFISVSSPVEDTQGIVSLGITLKESKTIDN